MVEKNELKKPTSMLGDEEPKDDARRIIDLYLLLRRWSQNPAGYPARCLAGYPAGYRASHSRLPGRLTRDNGIPGSLVIPRSFHSRFQDFRPKISFFIVKSIFDIVKMIRRKFPKFSYM